MDDGRVVRGSQDLSEAHTIIKDAAQPRRLGRKSRARRACAPCRLSKVKCEGTEPCGRCEERGIMCLYAADRRSKRKPLPHQTLDHVPVQDAQRPDPVVPTEQSDLLIHEVHCSISGSDAAASSAMHLHYGPSSTFVFMRQLYRFLHGRSGSEDMTIKGPSANYTAEAISEFGYNSIFFGRDIASEGNSTLTSSAVDPENVPFDIASNYLELYLSSIHYALPFCEPATLRKLFYSWCSLRGSPDAQSSDSTLIIAILAVGATLTDHTTWAEALFRLAKANLDGWGDSINLRSVQILMLLSEFHTIRGRPNSSILALGAAVHKCLAIGLHHGISVPGSDLDQSYLETDRSRAQERQSTFWVLYSRDRISSLSVGRPATLNDLDIAVSDPTFDRNLQAMVTLARISNKTYYGVYGRKKGSITDFCKKVNEIRDELFSFRESLAPEMRLPLNEFNLTTSIPHMSTSQMVLAFEFCQTTIVTLRPCLVLDAVQRRNAMSAGDSSSVIPVEWQSSLSAAAQLCTQVSMHIIYLFASAIDQNPIIGRMRHSRFFLEGACFVLLFDILRDPSRPECEQNFQAVAEGLQCFARLQSDKLILICMSAITNMLRLTKKRVANYISNNEQNQTHGPALVSSDILEESMTSQQQMTGCSQDNVLSEIPVDAFTNTTAAYGNENIDFFNNDIFDLSYYLWTEDGAPTNMAW